MVLNDGIADSYGEGTVVIPITSGSASTLGDMRVYSYAEYLQHRGTARQVAPAPRQIKARTADDVRPWVIGGLVHARSLVDGRPTPGRVLYAGRRVTDLTNYLLEHMSPWALDQVCSRRDLGCPKNTLTRIQRERVLAARRPLIQKVLADLLEERGLLYLEGTGEWWLVQSAMDEHRKVVCCADRQRGPGLVRLPPRVA